MTMSVDDAIANLYPEAELFQPSCTLASGSNDWTTPSSFQHPFDVASQTHCCDTSDFCESGIAFCAKSSCAGVSCADNKLEQQQASIRLPDSADFDIEIEVFQSFSLNRAGQDTSSEWPQVTTSDVTTSGNGWKQDVAYEQPSHSAIEVHEENISSAPTPSTDSSTSLVSDLDDTCKQQRSDSPQSDCGSDGKSKRHVRPWTKEEHARFLVALEKFRTSKTEKIKSNGKQSTGLGPGIADVIALIVKTRDAAQVRSHAQKHFQRLRRERKAQ